MSRLGSYAFILLLVLWGVSACGLLNGPDDEVVDPRNLTWTVDTLAYPESAQTHMRSIWASSPTDVYVVGHNFRGFGHMYHYDGNEWTDVKPNHLEGGNIVGAISLRDIHGFAADNVWAVGAHDYTNRNPPPNSLDSSLIIHYDGQEWWEVATPPGRALHAIYGDSPNDIWAGGRFGTLFHYDGTAWTSDTIPLPAAYDTERYSYFQQFAGNGTGQLYSLYFDFIPNWNSHLLSHSDQQWTVLDSFYFEDHRSLWLSPSGKLYSASTRGVSTWEQDSWEWVLYGDLSTIGITGTSDENIFAVGYQWGGVQPGVVYHYNGIDWYRYSELKDLPRFLTDVWTDGREVFIVGPILGDYPQVSIILHGR